MTIDERIKSYQAMKIQKQNQIWILQNPDTPLPPEARVFKTNPRENLLKAYRADLDAINHILSHYEGIRANLIADGEKK